MPNLKFDMQLRVHGVLFHAKFHRDRYICPDWAGRMGIGAFKLKSLKKSRFQRFFGLPSAFPLSFGSSFPLPSPSFPFFRPSLPCPFLASDFSFLLLSMSFPHRPLFHSVPSPFPYLHFFTLSHPSSSPSFPSPSLHFAFSR